ncbi:MAG: preprotein translocase subunit SecE [Oscillospiraceae bacterium]|jgi:preprotein translocase SecE subunit|nr:preprotein translocase subunit SecE [Oscillospiraceae bacterium]
MAKKDDKVESAASLKLKEAEKALEKRQKTKAAVSKSGGKQPFVLGKFWKDFRADTKKVIWPDFKTIMRNTGIVLVMVAIVGAAVYLIDLGMTEALIQLHNLAEKVNPTPEATLPPTSTAAPALALLLPGIFG